MGRSCSTVGQPACSFVQELCSFLFPLSESNHRETSFPAFMSVPSGNRPLRHPAAHPVPEGPVSRRHRRCQREPFPRRHVWTHALWKIFQISIPVHLCRVDALYVPFCSCQISAKLPFRRSCQCLRVRFPLTPFRCRRATGPCGTPNQPVGLFVQGRALFTSLFVHVKSARNCLSGVRVSAFGCGSL